MSSSLPLSRETPNEPFGHPSFLPEDLALARTSRMARRWLRTSCCAVETLKYGLFAGGGEILR